MNQISSFSNINYPTPPSSFICDVAFGLGVALESGGVAASMVGLAQFGVPSMFTGRFVRIVESGFCRNANLIDCIWKSPWDFASDLYQIASIYAHRKYTLHLKANIKKFNKAKLANVGSLEKVYHAADKLAQSIKVSGGTATGETAKILKRNTALLTQQAASAVTKAKEAAIAKVQWEAAQTAVSPSKTILQLFKPLHIALTTIPPVVMKFFQKNSVKEGLTIEEHVRSLTNEMLDLARRYDIVYGNSLDLYDESVKIDLNLKDIAAQAHRKLSKRINDLNAYVIALNNLLKSTTPPATSSQILEAISALHKQIENELGLKTSAADFIRVIINNTDKDVLISSTADGIEPLTPLDADGTRPLIDLQQIAILALEYLNPSLMDGLKVRFKLNELREKLMLNLKYLIYISQSIVETTAEDPSNEVPQSKKKEAIPHIADTCTVLDKLANNFTQPFQ